MVTKKYLKKRLESEKWFKRKSIMESLALLVGFCSLICIIIKMPTAAGIFLMLAMLVLVVSVFLDAKGKKYREQEREEEKIQKVRAMLSKDEVRKIYPKVDNYEEKYNLARILRQIEKNPECDIAIEATLMDDESIWITLEVNGSIIEEYRYTDYELFLSTWEVR